MNGESLEAVGGFFGDFGGRLAMAAGSCETHGAASVLVRTGTAWHCPKCLEAEMAADTEAKVLAESRAWRMKVAMIPSKYVGAMFPAATPAQKGVRSTVASFRDFILRERQWATLIMTGETGTGKTLLACEFAQALVSKTPLTVRYITAAGMISEIQATYGSRDGKSSETEIMRFAQYDVLILDEIDAIRKSDDADLLLTEIINRRYNEGKPIVAISNQALDGLKQFVGARVHSRLYENSFPCAFTWGDFRRAGVQQTGATA